MELTPSKVYNVPCHVNNAYDCTKRQSYYRSGRKKGEPGVIFDHIIKCKQIGWVFLEDAERRATILRE